MFSYRFTENGLGAAGGGALAAAGVYASDLEQDLFGREIDQQEPVVVAAARDVVNLDRTLAVGQHVFVGERLEHGALARTWRADPG